MTTKPTYDELMQEHHAQMTMSELELQRGWNRIVRARPEAAELVFVRDEQGHWKAERVKQPWLSRRQKLAFVAECIVLAIVAALVCMATACSFPEEGTGATPDFYSPPRPYPFHSSGAGSDSGDASGSSSAGPEDAETGSAATGSAATSSSAEDSSGDEDSSSSEQGESSSSGEPPEVDATHCTEQCDVADRVRDDGDEHCVCAPECTEPEDCDAPSTCYYGRCVVPDCDDPAQDCPSPDMVCGAWTMFHTICFWPGEA